MSGAWVSVGASPDTLLGNLAFNRFFHGALAVLTALASASGAASAADRVTLYAAAGPELIQYDVDVTGAALTRRASTILPENVQYAWPHASRRSIYVAWSNATNHHGVSAFRILSSGAREPLGKPVPLAFRPIHITTDIPSTHVLIAYNIPSSLTVHELGADGSIGALVKQTAPLETGIYAHQIRVEPSNNTVILVTRGNGPANGKPEDPGALKILGYKNGLLMNRLSIAPGGGFGFQPRHLDFHPSKPWIFLSLERQNKLEVYGESADGTLTTAPLFIKDSLLDPRSAIPTQVAGTVHVAPNGKFVYQANRAAGTAADIGSLRAGGTNSIAVYAIDPATGEPTLIQNADTHGMTPRTFALDSSGRILIAANQSPFSGGTPNLAVFRVRNDGKLDFVRKYDVATNSLFWMGLVSVP